MPLLFPKPQHSFLDLFLEDRLLGKVAVSSSAIIRLVRSLWHLNKRLPAFGTNDFDMGNPDTADILRRETARACSRLDSMSMLLLL